MALIDDLTRRLTSELHRALDPAIRHAVESYVVGDGQDNKSTERPALRAKAAERSRQDRSRTIIDAVAKLKEATVEDVARVTGLDKRGVGSSLHYLAEAGKLKHSGSGKYKATRIRRAA